MNERDLPEQLGARFGWTLEDETTAEGAGHRTPVATEEGERALLYTFDDELTARRVAKAHDPSMAAQMFVVPERIDHGMNWVLVTHIEGHNLADEFDGVPCFDKLPSGRAGALIESLGNTVRKLHLIGVPGYGDLLDEEEGGERYLTFSGWAAQQLERFSDAVRTRGFDDRDVSRLNASIAELRHELSAHHPRSPAWLSHGRLQLEHVWVDDATGAEVVGLTGFQNASILPRGLDIAHLLWIDGVGADDHLIRTFYKTYGAARTMDVQRRERFFRRLAAFLALSGFRGPSSRSDDELITLTER